MKTCAYCGRQSADEATHCQECGTQFAAPAGEAKPAPREWAWFRFVLANLTILLLIILVYLLSFGPVLRYTSTVISQNTTSPASTAVNQGSTNVIVTQTTVVRTVRHARWVRVLYYPAFSLAFGSSRTTGPMALYQNYVGWWMQRPEQP